VYLLSVITFGKSAREDDEMFGALDGILPTNLSSDHRPLFPLPLSAAFKILVGRLRRFPQALSP